MNFIHITKMTKNDSEAKGYPRRARRCIGLRVAVKEKVTTGSTTS